MLDIIELYQINRKQVRRKMTENHEQSDSQTANETVQPLLRQDIQAGLRQVHGMLVTAQNESNTASAYIRALAFILVEKGILKQNELEMLMRQVRWEIIQKPTPRVRLGSIRDKYTAAGSAAVDCASLMPICHGRCCTFAFYLTKQDLDEGIVRWDYGNPYWIKQGADGHCTHSDPVTRFCTIHANRPFPCRKFDCRNDERIWLDFEKKITAPPLPAPGDDQVAMAELLLHKEALEAKKNWMNPEDS
jgi:Fe-S-cluster containining protein